MYQLIRRVRQWLIRSGCNQVAVFLLGASMITSSFWVLEDGFFMGEGLLRAFWCSFLFSMFCSCFNLMRISMEVDFRPFSANSISVRPSNVTNYRIGPKTRLFCVRVCLLRLYCVVGSSWAITVSYCRPNGSAACAKSLLRFHYIYAIRFSCYSNYVFGGVRYIFFCLSNVRTGYVFKLYRHDCVGVE